MKFYLVIIFIITFSFSILSANDIDTTKEINTSTISNIIEVGTYSDKVQIHPIFVHFALIFPIVAFLIALITLIRYKKIGFVDFIFLSLSLVTIYFAISFGDMSYELILEHNISNEIKEKIIFHQKIGYILLFMMIVLMVIRMILFVYKPLKFIGLYLFSFMIFIVFSVYQGYTGTNLVYKYAVGIYYNIIDDL
jgi:uncharacterized membrane protein